MILSSATVVYLMSKIFKLNIKLGFYMLLLLINVLLAFQFNLLNFQ